jgi:hypothetical protein
LLLFIGVVAVVCCLSLRCCCRRSRYHCRPCNPI